MKWEPRDVIVFALVLAIILHPTVTLVAVLVIGRPLTEAGTAAIEQILVAMVAVISGYVAGRADRP